LFENQADRLVGEEERRNEDVVENVHVSFDGSRLLGIVLMTVAVCN